MKTYTIHLPLHIPYGNGKSFALNLNQYRNEQFFNLNKVKVIFHEAIGTLLDGIPKMERVYLRYTLYLGSKRRTDLANVCSVVDKFFSDTLVEHGILPDDSYEHIQHIDFRFGGLDKENPRLEALIVDLDSLTDHEEKTMRITLVQSEIEEALTAYLRGKIVITEGQHLNIEFKATRGEEGYLAEIELENRKTPLETVSKPAKSESDLTAKDVFASPIGTALQIENSAIEQKTAEQPRTEAPVTKAEVTPPQSTEPVQVASPVTAETVPAQGAPTAVPASESKSLFANLTPPVNSVKVA